MKGTGVIFRRIGGRIIPLYRQHEQAANLALGAATVVGAGAVATKTRHALASRTMGKNRRGFGNPISNFVFDSAVGGALVYGAASRFRPVQKGLVGLSKLVGR